MGGSAVLASWKLKSDCRFLQTILQSGLTDGVIRAMFASSGELCVSTTIVTRVDHMAAAGRAHALS
jgi:hypothetical protein